MSNRRQTKSTKCRTLNIAMEPTFVVHVGDCLDVLKTMADSSIDCVVSSPPYFRLRQYLPADHPDKAAEIGQEPTVDEFVEALVQVFDEVRRVLKPKGTLWLNLGDVYAGYDAQGAPKTGSGIKTRDLCLLPYRVALAMQAAGWWVRSNIVWAKPEPGPENVTSRPVCAHEALFLMTKRQEGYFFDANSLREPYAPASLTRFAYNVSCDERGGLSRKVKGGKKKLTAHPLGRHGRNVWPISTRADARTDHNAAMPVAMAVRCIKAGCPVGGTVLDPFAGSGTTGIAALKLGCDAVLIEINPEFAKIADHRLTATRSRGRRAPKPHVATTARTI